MNEIPLNGFQNNALTFVEASALSLLFSEYADNYEFEQISEIGFSTHSGLAYISLESVDYDLVTYLFNRTVKYLYRDNESGEEILFDTIEDYQEFKEEKYSEEE